MPTFLSKDQIYRILQRELPEGAYPDGAPSAYFSTADMYSIATAVGTLYRNLSSIYDNFFPATTDDKIADWEFRSFGHQLDSSLTLQQRRDRVIAQIRTRRRTTPTDILQTVYTVIDSSILVEIVEHNSVDGGWVLDESELDVSSILNGYSGVQFGLNVDWCAAHKNPALIGLTREQITEYQDEAYTYDVRIYDYVLTTAQRAQLEEVLRAAEPARSRHVILDGLDPADMISGET